MKKNKIHRKLIITIIFIVFIVFIFYVVRIAVPKISCPDAMINNLMPTIHLDQDYYNRETRYYIKDGKRKEFNEYNYLWARYICGVKPQVVW